MAARPIHFYYLCDKAREEEKRQYVLTHKVQGYNSDVVAATMVNLDGFKFSVMGLDGYPVCSFGSYEIVPGVWQAWMSGTDVGWGRHSHSITKASLWLAGELFKMGARRVQVAAIESRTKTIEWYERGLRMKHEGTLKNYAMNGESLLLYGRTS